MTVDFENTKVNVFSDVNDTPIEPTQTNAGNGSHLIQQHNKLVSSTEAAINNLLSQVGKDWQVVNSDYTANQGDKIVFKTNQPLSGKATYYLNLPSSPPVGSSVTFININPSIILAVRNFGGMFNGFSGVVEASVQDSYVTRTLVYTGGQVGWMPTATDDYTKTFDNSVNT